MSDDQDEELGRMLRADAPAERDALFRIGLLEHRERRRYESRRRMLFVAAAAAVLLFAVVIALARNLPHDELLDVGIAAMFAIALTMASVGSLRGARQALRWMRRM